jgi:sn1-specific diacylglycerol lipase
VYCYAPPCVCDAALGKRARGMITSIACGSDVVSRLSLGSVRDMTRAAAWLCAAGREDKGSEGATAVTTRALRYRAGMGKEGDAEWVGVLWPGEHGRWADATAQFLAIRKTLEANMHMADLFPPGRVWWAVRDAQLHPSNQLPDTDTGTDTGKLRLFEVLDVEKVFGQIDFSGDMLRWACAFLMILRCR